MGVLQGAGLLMILPMLQVLGLEGSEAQLPDAVKRLLTGLEQLGIPFTLGSALSLYLGLIAVNALTRLFQTIIQSDLLNQQMRDVNQVTNAVQQSLSVMVSLMITLLYVASACLVSWRATLLSVLVGGTLEDVAG